MQDKKILINIKYTNSVSNLDEVEKALMKKAQEACNTAYSPYSKFKVGAAILLENGKVITGSNQENAAYPSGLCAERVAMFYANASNNNSAIVAIAIASATEKGLNKKAVFPCGACRQSLLESEIRFGKDIKVITAGTEDVYIIPNIKSLLPLGFSKF